MMTSGDRPIFIDTNILVYANILAYPLHSIAAEHIQSLLDAEVELWLIRQVLREFIAAVTRPQTYGNPQPIEVVVTRVQTFQAQFQVIEDSPQVTAQLLSLLQQFPTAGRQVHDANVGELADQDTLPQSVTSAIRSLLGLELPDRLSADLNVLTSRKRKSLATAQEQAHLEVIEQRLEKPQVPKRSALEILTDAHTLGSFRTPEEIDQYIQDEKNSWDS